MSQGRTAVSLVNYVPSSFATSEASAALTRYLLSANHDEKVMVILHGLHAADEDRFLSDTICPEQKSHIWLMLHRAESIIALSEIAAEACRTWRARYGGKARIVRIDHPGLYAAVRVAGTGVSYAFLGGISRSKKDHTTGRIGELIELCENRGIRVWQHWTNVTRQVSTKSWRQTSGVLTDAEWTSAILNARVVMCPYQTRIQSVSGLISEALSADRSVLATSFDLSHELQLRFPSRIYIEDDLERWPNLILQLPCSAGRANASIPTWDSFARHLAVEFMRALPPGESLECLPQRFLSVRSGERFLGSTPTQSEFM